MPLAIGIGMPELIIILAILLFIIILPIVAVLILWRVSKGKNRTAELENRIERLEQKLGRASEPTPTKSGDLQ